MFKFEKNMIYHMPSFFGGYEFDPDMEARVNDAVSLTFTQITDGDRLADYLPEGFELLRPELTITYCQLRDVEFMSGGGYNLVQISVPVRFNGKRDKLEGSFPLVIWENNTRPIIGGREESGQPKIFADIQDLHKFQGKYFTNVSYDGNTFLHLDMTGAQPVDESVLRQMQAGSTSYNMIGWRYIPKVGEPGAELSQPVLYPQGMEVKAAQAGAGTVEWTRMTPEQNLSQYHIINALADLPIKGMGPVLITNGAIIMKPFAGRVLE